MVQYLGTVRRFNRPTVLFLCVCTLHSFAFMGIYSLLVNLYLLRLGYGTTVIGLFNGVADMAIAAFALPAAALARRWRLKSPMVVGLSCSAALIAALPVAELLHGTARTGWLVMVSALTAFALSLWFVNGNPFMMALVDAGERSRAFSIRWALLALGGFAGNLVGGSLPPAYAAVTGSSVEAAEPFRYALWTSAALIAIVAIGMARTPERHAPDIAGHALKGFSGTGAARLITLFLVATVLLQAAATSVRIFFNVYMDTDLGADTVLIGSLSGAGRLLAVPAALAMPILAAKVGHGRTSAVASMIGAFALLPIALVPRVGAAGVGLLSMNLTMGLFWPSFQIYSMSMVRPNKRPLIYGSIIGASGLTGALLGTGGGYLVAAAGFREFFLLSSALTLLGAGVFWLALLRRGQRAGESGAAQTP